MNPILRTLAFLLGVASATPGQEILWDLYGPYDHIYRGLDVIGDYDLDGKQDLIIKVYPFGQSANVVEIRILSGDNGQVLWQSPVNSRQFVPAGDFDGDGSLDFVSLWPWATYYHHRLEVWSPKQNRQLWHVLGSAGGEFGFDFIGDLDSDGDGNPNVITLTRNYFQSDVYVYDHVGRLQYTVPMVPLGLQAISLAAMEDIDGDGCDEFIVGGADQQALGTVLLVSGRTGQILRTTYGQQPGDKTFWHATNVGDLDGDGTSDYAAFPWWSASRLMAQCWSGATGALLRSWPEYTESVIVEDLDLDGVNDIVLGWEYPIQPPNVYGRTIAISGRDSTTLWHVDNYSGSWQGPFGWGRHAASLGKRAGSPYPVIAWQDQDYWNPTYAYNVAQGRNRVWRANFAGQGPIVGTPCSSTGTQPQIGVRHTDTGARITVAHAPPGALAFANLAIGNPSNYLGVPLPAALDAFGMPGCQLYVGPDVAFATTTGTTGIDRGYAAIDLAHDLAPSLGTIVQAQWIVFDFATLDHALTAKHQIRLQ